VDFDSRRVPAAKAQAGVAETYFHGIAERSDSDDLHLLALDYAQFHETLHQRWVALKRQHAATLAGPKLIEGWHSSPQDWANEDLASTLAAKAQSAAADIEQARTARLDDLNV
jgi:hypothetical protein